MDGWLSLKVSEKPVSGKQSSRRFPLLISVPKKAVRLATRRNRLKRLIREAFRKSTGLREDVVYGFRVRFEPGDALKLAAVQAAMKKLLEENV